MTNPRFASRTIFAALLAVVALALPAVAADRYVGFEGSATTKAVYDFRAADPAKASVYLGLIHDMVTDAAVTANGAPEYTVVFMGPGVKMVGQAPAGASADEKAAYRKVADKIAAMAADGVDFEVCLFAVGLVGLDPDTLHADARKIHNGWISSIGYQQAGYAMIPVF